MERLPSRLKCVENAAFVDLDFKVDNFHPYIHMNIFKNQESQFDREII